MENKKSGNDGYGMDLVSRYRGEIYGFLILWIMLFHGCVVDVYFFTDTPVLKYLGIFINHGNAGVEGFFLLSGISLYYSFQKNREIGQYIRKRLFKIYLPVLIIGGISWIIFLFLGENSVWHVILNLSGLRFFFDGNQEIWFVSMILIFYLLYPYIYAFIFKDDSGKGVLVRTILLMLLVMVVIYSITAIPTAVDAYRRTEIGLTRLPVFILGCGIGKFVYEKRRISLLGWIVIAIVCFAAFVIIEQVVFLDPYRRFVLMPAGVPLVFLLALMMSKLPDLMRVPFRFLGQMTLELYVMHTVLRRFYKSNLLFFGYREGSWRRYLLKIALSIVLSWFVILLEKQIQKRK